MRFEAAISELAAVVYIKEKQARELLATREGTPVECRFNLQRAEDLLGQVEQMKAAMKVLWEDPA